MNSRDECVSRMFNHMAHGVILRRQLNELFHNHLMAFPCYPAYFGQRLIKHFKWLLATTPQLQYPFGCANTNQAVLAKMPPGNTKMEGREEREEKAKI